MQRNRLAAETSPYLRQHADNPVDWYPWGAAALAAAKKNDQPILLSIGYAACHWCHVMARESFEDAETAALMNELFVNIKVDREERPDLDTIYQMAQQLITHNHGGWPLTMFLTPAQQPFFGGTYFPRKARQGMPAFKELLRRVADYYEHHRAAIGEQTQQLNQAFAALAPHRAARGTVLSDAPLQDARRALERTFDTQFGGFTQAPKFPHPGSIERCMRAWYATAAQVAPDLRALYMASLTLTRMAEGGLYDQLGGGFSRYSIDGMWMIPHFEKMLYDNALLLCEYARAHLATGEALFARIANETADWALRDMRSHEGGFFSSLDADSQGEEGKFYLWNPAEAQSLLSPQEYAALSVRFGLDRPANFEGQWHLHTAGAGGDEVLLQEARAKLLRARNLRVWPARDEKILTAWNALMIKGLSIAARVLQRPDLAEAAARAVDFLRERLWREGRLLATYKDGRAHVPAYLDDYAFLADALLELLQTRWRSSDLRFARELTDAVLSHFEDKEQGGFFFTADDHERLIHRSKSYSDEALPSGNGVFASVLHRMGSLLGDTFYLEAAERALQAVWPSLLEYPQAHMACLNALEDFLATMQVLIIRGDAPTAHQWARELGALYAPMRTIFAIPDQADDLPEAIRAKSGDGAPRVYLCTGLSCSAPMNDLAEVSRALKLRIA